MLQPETKIIESNVVVTDEKGDIVKEYTVTVEVINMNSRKPYLGGFKNVKNGLIYHHAFA